jgi:hypothetical protein
LGRPQRAHHAARAVHKGDFDLDVALRRFLAALQLSSTEAKKKIVANKAYEIDEQGNMSAAK